MSDLRLVGLESYVNDCDVFFETGTYKGGGLDYAMSFNFNKLYSVEIEDQKIPYLTDKYKSNSKVKIFHGTSVDAFKSFLPEIKSNTLFWLDAHYPDLVYSKYAPEDSPDYERTVRLPLESELLYLKEYRKGFKDVIIFDDLLCFLNGGESLPDWLKPRVKFQADFYKKIFEDTHDYVQLDIAEVIGILIPK